jgi:hypothetical protein
MFREDAGIRWDQSYMPAGLPTSSLIKPEDRHKPYSWYDPGIALFLHKHEAESTLIDMKPGMGEYRAEVIPVRIVVTQISEADFESEPRYANSNPADHGGQKEFPEEDRLTLKRAVETLDKLGRDLEGGKSQ